jgi:hypothetical protein
MYSVLFGLVITASAGAYGWRRLLISTKRTNALRERAAASVKTMLAAAAFTFGAATLLGQLPLPFGAGGAILAPFVLVPLAAAGIYATLWGIAPLAPHARTFPRLVSTVARATVRSLASWFPTFIQSIELARTDVARATKGHGSRRWVVIAGIALICAVLLVTSYGSGRTVVQLGREFGLLWATTVLVSSTMPVALTWVVVSLAADRSQVIRIMREASDLVGTGLVAGFVAGSLALFVNAGGGIPALQDPKTFSFDTVIATSLLGSVVGFAVAHLKVLVIAARGYTSSLTGYSFAAAASIVIAAITSNWVPPQKIAAHLVDSIVAGVTIPGSTFDPETTDWRVTFLLAKHRIVSEVPTNGWFLFGFASVVIVTMASCLLIDANRTALATSVLPARQHSKASRFDAL